MAVYDRGVIELGPTNVYDQFMCCVCADATFKTKNQWLKYIKSTHNDMLLQLLYNKIQSKRRRQQQDYDKHKGTEEITPDEALKLSITKLSDTLVHIKSFIEFQSQHNDIDSEIIKSIIIILLLETRFSSASSLWYGIVRKARNQIMNLLGNDSNKLDQLINDVGNQL